VPEAIAFVDLNREHAQLADELSAAFERVRERGGFILGEEVEAFEREFAAYCGAEQCVGVASGTAALTLALIAAGIGPGNEVIVPAHTYIASALAVVHAGARPVFCDVLEDTGLIDIDAAQAALTGSTAAILPVHLYGQACDMDAVEAFAKRHGIAVIEDAAQAHGARFRDARVGSLGLAGCFSFYPSKNLGAMGDGGAVCTDDSAIAQRVRELRNLGQRTKGTHVRAGMNERLDALQAALLRVKLPHLDARNSARADHAARYRHALDGHVRLVAEREEAPSVHHLFPVRLADRDALASALAAQGIQTGVHYTPAVHQQPPFEADGRVRDRFPVAEAWAREELSLPMFPGLEECEVQRVSELCIEHLCRHTPTRSTAMDPG
jgi:dTDP-4-amino-4,6-dideoxygalactose transaminase